MESNERIGHFERELLSWKLTSSIVRGLFLQICVLVFSSFVFTFMPLAPIAWIWNNVALFLTPSAWCYDLIILGCYVGLGYLNTRRLQLSPSLPESRLASVFSFVTRLSILISLAAHVIGAGIVVRGYLGLHGGSYSSLIVSSCHNSSSGCISRAHVFLILSALWAGFCVWFDLHFKHGNVLVFPFVQESGSTQLRRSLLPLLKKSILKVISDLRWFYAAYFCFGSRVEVFLSQLIKIPVVGYPDNSTWDQLLLEQLFLLLTAISLSTLFTYSVLLMNKVIHINFTKPLALTPDMAVQLIDIMQSKNPFVRHWSFRHFATVETVTRSQRAQFFAISQPGGHPHTWNTLKSICLNMIDSLIQSLNDTNTRLGIVHHEEETFRKRMLAVRQPAIKSANEPSFMGRRQDAPHSEALSSSSASLTPKSSSSGSGSAFSFAKKTESWTIFQWFSLWSKNSVFSNCPDLKLRIIFGECQTLIWMLDGMSHLIAASVHEDRYGVVQKDLDQMLIRFISLNAALERYKSVSAAAGKKGRFEHRDQQLKQELRSCVKAAIYRIVVEFGDSIRSIPLPSEFEKKILSFAHFMEA